MANNPYVNKVQFGNQTLIDLTSDTVTADKLMQGYTAHDRTGALITGTATGGGSGGNVWQDAQGYVHLDDEGTTPITVEPLSVTQNGTYTATTGHAYSPVTVNVSGGGGLEYEEGTFTPSEDVAKPTINFTNSHTNPPMFYMFYDATATEAETESNTNFGVVFGSWYNAFGDWIHRLNDGKQYGAVRYIYSTTGNSVTLSILDSTSNAASTIYWATNSAITPRTGSESRYWRAGRTYKWVAVWAPTT